jgi:uncharacterized protein (DUF305 family)
MLNISQEVKMKTIQSRVISAVCAGLFVFGVSGSSFAQNGHAQHGTVPATGAQQHAGGEHEMMKSMEDMHQKMSSMKMTGDHDHDFAMMMRSHHQAGIDMAQAELKNGKDRQMQQMAKKVISDQTKEIKKLDDWLSKHKTSAK